MACDCIAEINAAITSIENSVQSHTDIKADQVRDFLYDAIAGWFNTQFAWDNDHGPSIDTILSQVNSIRTEAISNFTITNNGIAAARTDIATAQSVLNESIETTEDIAVYLRDTSFPNAIGTLENHIENHTDVKSDQIRDAINAHTDTKVNAAVTTINAFTDADGGNTREYLASRIETARANLHVDVQAVADQVTALTALLSTVVGADTSRNWTLHP